MELDGYLRFILALVFVLGLIGIFAALARRFGFGYRRPQVRGAARRLSIVEVMPVDAKRRLVLVRRDESEHLILLGATADLVVEADIPAADFAAALAETEPTAAAVPTEKAT
jgi:flagellar protein FliO/FliZ